MRSSFVWRAYLFSYNMLVQQKGLGKLSNELLAEYIVARCPNVSHLKIQKLLYYIQGYHLAFFDAPIIDDSFEA